MLSKPFAVDCRLDYNEEANSYIQRKHP